MTETFGRTITQEIYNKRYSISITIIISRYKQIFDTEKPITSTACIIDQFNGFNQTQSAENKLESTCIYVTSHILCTLHQTIQSSLPWSHFIQSLHNFKALFTLVFQYTPSILRYAKLYVTVPVYWRHLCSWVYVELLILCSSVLVSLT